MAEEYMNNDLGFTPIHVPAYRMLAIYGKIIDRMPDYKKAIGQGYRIGTYHDLITNRMELSAENDRTLLNDYAFILIGNPTLTDPDRSGEQMIINNLEQKIFEPIKMRLLDMDGSTNFNQNLSLPLAQNEKELYEHIKAQGLSHITVIKPEQVEIFREDNYALPNIREQILEGLLLGDVEKKNRYIRHVQDATDTKDLSRILGFKSEIFPGIRIIVSEALRNNSDISSISPKISGGYMLATGDEDALKGLPREQ